MKVGLIVADMPHLKTQQVAFALRLVNGFKVTVLVTTFHSRPKRQTLFAHRPTGESLPTMKDLQKARLDISVNRFEWDPTVVNDFDALVMTGGVVVPNSFLQSTEVPIYNVHPGLIPRTRGLDAFKWAIYHRAPIGNTLHRIDERIDMGSILKQIKTPLFMGDSLHSFAARHYHLELWLTTNFFLFMYFAGEAADDSDSIGASTKRMPNELESELDARFEEYKLEFALDA